MHAQYGVKALHTFSFTVTVILCISEERELIDREVQPFQKNTGSSPLFAATFAINNFYSNSAFIIPHAENLILF